MLTYPSDPLPQIVCPMDEDAIPPNSFCSAPPHREPPPPLLPLSSTTPSCANDGASGHRRSGRIQSIRAQTPQKQSSTDSRAAPRPPRQNPSPSKRQKESMVQVSQSKQPKVDGTPGHENQNEEVLAFSRAAEHQNKKKRKTPLKKPDVSAAEDIAEQIADDTKQNPDAAKSDMDACGGLSVGHNVENTSAPKGWVIGPLFQSLKSKMASFTEIVMSPVKLFRANSPPPSMDHPDELGECELRADDILLSEPSDLFNPVAQIENGTQETKANQQRLSKVEGAQKPVALKYSKRLSFDSDLSTRSSGGADECAITAKEMNSPDSVPLRHSPSPCVASEEASEYVGSFIKSSILTQPSVNVSASHECDLKMPKSVEGHKGKLSVRGRTLPRRCMGTRSEADRRKKVTSKTLTSEVTMEETSEVVNEQVSCPVLVKSSDDDKTLSVSSSVCYTHPDGEDVDDGRETGSCQTLGNVINGGANGRTLKPPLDSQQPNPETFPAAGLGKVKRGLHLDSDVQETVKRKRIKAATNTKKQELLTPASDKAVLRGLNPASKEVASTNIVDMEETLKPARKRQPAKTRVNKKGKAGQDALTTINESLPSTQAEISSDAMSVCSLEKSSSVSESKQKKPSASHKRLKAKTDRSKADVNMDSCMDLETTVAITSTKETELQTLPEVLVRPNIKELQRRNINKKPVKRKTPSQSNQSNPESGSSAVSIPSALSLEPSELTSTDFNTSELVEKQESRKQAINQPSKRAKKGCRGAVKASVSGGTQETKQCIQNNLKTKENQSEEGDGKMSTDPVYFEMTPFESSHQPVSSAPESRLDCSVQLNKDDTQSLNGKENNSVSQEEECFPTEAEAGNHSSVFRRRSSAKGVNMRPRRDDQRRKCRVLHRRARKGDQEMNSVTMDDADLAAAACSSENDPSKRLLRSYSCPEIPSVHPLEAPWTSSLHSPHHSRTHTHHHHQPAHTFSSHVHKSLRRARRHTVCSVEVEREIAPLCLRKEVYPSRRSFPYDAATQHLSPTLALSPSTSLSALASSFLSSPLAFLSKKADSRGATSPSTSTHVSSTNSSSSSSIFSLSPSTWRLPGFLPRADPSSAASDCGSSGIPLECEIKRRQQSDEEDDCEDTSSSSQEFEDVGLREEKALSDSEIKVVQKHEERGKVSSIRIRKALPKPQNNLTPMGLPKPVRLKKKEFSLEEIYTNKNFSKPPESRLETIFEVPLNRRNGSESWFGQRRLKRFLEFLEVGEARKPKKSLVGVAKAGNSSSRTRRGCFPKDEPPLGLQDVDSLLCAKLDQLNLWLIHDQNDS